MQQNPLKNILNKQKMNYFDQAKNDLKIVKELNTLLKLKPLRFFKITTFIYALCRILYYLYKFKNPYKKVNGNIFGVSFDENSQKNLKIINKQMKLSFFGIIDEKSHNIPLNKIALYSLKLLFKKSSIKQLLELDNEYIPWWSDIILYISTYQWMSNQNFEKSTTFIFLNDHSAFDRAIFRYAKTNRFTTIYIQHASVSSIFPRLEFDYALLDGLDALKKYYSIGKIDSIIYLTGRVAPCKERSNKQTSINIALCLSTIDSMKDWINIIKQLKKNTSWNLICRPHPRDRRKFLWKIVCNHFNIKYSAPNISMCEFISDINTAIVGQSNIILELAINGIPSINILFSSDSISWDYYGFQSKKLTIPTAIENLEQTLTTSLSENNREFNAKENSAFFDLSALIGKSEIHNALESIINKKSTGFVCKQYNCISCVYIPVSISDSEYL